MKTHVDKTQGKNSKAVAREGSQKQIDSEFTYHLEDNRPEAIAQKINEIIENKAMVAHWKKNLSFAAQDLSWEIEEQVLKQVYGKYI